MDIITTIQRTFEDYEVDPSQSMIVGFSGGSDSAALAVAMATWRLAKDVHLLHVNHHWNTDSNMFQRQCENMAAKIGLPIHIADFHPQDKGNLEEASRNARYNAFKELADSVGARVILTAHHADDQAETVLFHILRGSGVHGIPVIRPFSADRKDLTVFRPAINLSHQDLVEFLKKRNHKWVEDPSNRKIDFLRNKIRHSLIPMLKRDFNPSIQKAICRLSQKYEGQNEFH
jgi:tRNA(Ile)-lysidine synthase